MIHDPLYKSLLLLREHAIASGHNALAITLSWSCIRIAGDEVAKRLIEIIRRKVDGCGND